MADFDPLRGHWVFFFSRKYDFFFNKHILIRLFCFLNKSVPQLFIVLPRIKETVLLASRLVIYSFYGGKSWLSRLFSSTFTVSKAGCIQSLFCHKMNDSSGFVLEILHPRVRFFFYSNFFFLAEPLYSTHSRTQADALDFELVFVGGHWLTTVKSSKWCEVCSD